MEEGKDSQPLANRRNDFWVKESPVQSPESPLVLRNNLACLVQNYTKGSVLGALLFVSFELGEGSAQDLVKCRILN